MRKNTPKKEERIIYKGIYIANQRRKGPGGRIKCAQFPNKIQVLMPNQAIHQSQVQWVEIRRYTRGQKRQRRPKKQSKNQKPQAKSTVESKSTSKFVEKSQKKNQVTTGQKESKKQIPADSEDKKQKKKPKYREANPQKKSENQNALSSDIVSKNNQKQVSQVKQVKQVAKLEEKQTDLQGQQECRSDASESDSDQNDQQSKDTLDGKTKEVEGKILTKEQEEKKKQDEQIIVAKIIKQDKIVFKEKRFVAIMTCERKSKNKGKVGNKQFTDKNLGAVDRILNDYYLDISPIHLRLPKMQMDVLVKNNVSVLAEYIEKKFPQKGKQLKKSTLNSILDEIESIYIVATFGCWDKNDRAYADIHQIIGETMTIEGECNCYLFEHQLNGFTYELPEQETQTKTEKKQPLQSIQPNQKHTKFNKLVFTIDPATSIDLDDALSIEQLQNGNYEIGIHIADVSEYLKYIKRQELSKRTTSVYLPHKVYHMLTEDIMTVSSLNPGVDRLAFSIYVKMNNKGQIVSQSRLEKNIIQSKYKLSYQTVQDILTAKTSYAEFQKKYPSTQKKQFDILVDKLQSLARLALAHRQSRISFEVFQNKQVHFELDEDKWPIDIIVQSRFASKKIVEEFMIIGNIQAAKHLIRNHKDNSLVIYHPKPSDLSVKMFNETFKEFLDEDFEFENIRQVQKKFMQIQKRTDIPREIKEYMYFKGRRTQEAANYKLHHEAVQEIEKGSSNSINSTKNVHFALGQDCYTHFTSPMRRMADILVHQTLNSLIYKSSPPLISQEQIQKINDGRRHTKRLKRDISQMYICLMIHKTGKIIQQSGIVSSFGLKSLSVYIPYFDMMKEIMWKDQLQVHKVSKSRRDPQILDVEIYHDKHYPSRDIIWHMKVCILVTILQKFDKVELTIDCTRVPPLRLSISLEVQCKNRKEKIHAISLWA